MYVGDADAADQAGPRATLTRPCERSCSGGSPQVYNAIVRSLERLLITFELSPVLRDAVALLAEATSDPNADATAAGRAHRLASTGLLLSSLYTTVVTFAPQSEPDALPRSGPAASTAAAHIASGRSLSQLAHRKVAPLLNQVMRASRTDGLLLSEYAAVAGTATLAARGCAGSHGGASLVAHGGRGAPGCSRSCSWTASPWSRSCRWS